MYYFFYESQMADDNRLKRLKRRSKRSSCRLCHSIHRLLKIDTQISLATNRRGLAWLGVNWRSAPDVQLSLEQGLPWQLHLSVLVDRIKKEGEHLDLISFNLIFVQLSIDFQHFPQLWRLLKVIWFFCSYVSSYLNWGPQLVRISEHSLWKQSTILQI